MYRVGGQSRIESLVKEVGRIRKDTGLGRASQTLARLLTHQVSTVECLPVRRGVSAAFATDLSKAESSTPRRGLAHRESFVLISRLDPIQARKAWTRTQYSGGQKVRRTGRPTVASSLFVRREKGA